MDTTWYENEISRQLNDQSTYLSINITDTQETAESVEAEVLFLTQQSKFSHFFSDQVKKYLIAKSAASVTKIPEIYILPKIHKPKLAGRPIVPSHSWCTTALSRWLDDELQPLMKSISTVTLDSKTLVQKIESLKINHPKCILLTADVHSLYTEIPTSDGLRLMKSFLQTRVTDKSKIDLYMRVLQIILNNNCLKFKDKFYKQTKGTAMGTPCAPIYANIFLFMLEVSSLESLSIQPLLYQRYLDDIFAILITSDLVTEFTNKLNSMHPNIILDFNISNSRVEFLDLVIYKGIRFQSQGILDLKIHQKTLNMYLYIPYRSFHTSHNKSGLITTELIRYIRNTSDFKEYLHTKQLFYNRLRARGYPIKFLNIHFNQVRFANRNNYLLDSELSESADKAPLIFSTVYNPISKIAPIKIGIKTNWNILKTNPITRELFTQLPVMAWKKGPSLQKLLTTHKDPVHRSRATAL